MGRVGPHIAEGVTRIHAQVDGCEESVEILIWSFYIHPIVKLGDRPMCHADIFHFQDRGKHFVERADKFLVEIFNQSGYIILGDRSSHTCEKLFCINDSFFVNQHVA